MANKLSEVMTAKNMSASGLHEALILAGKKMSIQHIHCLMRGRSAPNVRVAFKMAKILGVPAEELFPEYL